MNHNITRYGDQSPFDAIKQTRADGTEFWSARDLMPLMGYGKWQAFEVPIERAMRSAANQGHDVDGNFTGSRKDAGSRGPGQNDFELSRFAAYLVAMNGDPNKPEVAAAQGYFAIRTHEAETRPALTGRELMARALLEADSTIKELESRANTAEKAIERQAPMVAKAQAHSSADTSITRQVFAREVQSFAKLHGHRVNHASVYRLLCRKGMTVTGHRSDAGHMTAKAIMPGWGFNDKGVSERNGHPYVTPKLSTAGQDLAWKWVRDALEQHGSALNPEAGAA